ncbi:MAG TPA: 3-hydroxyacyl-CoA dehydrogenase family protein [Flavisolibacter sp.]|nr:3-hydroxyacyl-CoA dehydrogenase family protein [Flavisolibacter sp.]
MQIVVLTDEKLREELTGKGVSETADLVWITEPKDFLLYKNATAFIDLLFVKETERINLLKSFLPQLVIINSVEHTLAESDNAFVRINGWYSFLRSPLVEASGDPQLRPRTEEIFSLFNRTIEWLPDEPGFVTARVVSMIINEAHHALSEGVSTTQEIDIAMQLGTNYPYGPFRWAEEIGTAKVRSLLTALARHRSRYQPSSLL